MHTVRNMATTRAGAKACHLQPHSTWHNCLVAHDASPCDHLLSHPRVDGCREPAQQIADGRSDWPPASPAAPSVRQCRRWRKCSTLQHTLHCRWDLDPPVLRHHLWAPHPAAAAAASVQPPGHDHARTQAAAAQQPSAATGSWCRDHHTGAGHEPSRAGLDCFSPGLAGGFMQYLPDSTHLESTTFAGRGVPTDDAEHLCEGAG